MLAKVLSTDKAQIRKTEQLQVQTMFSVAKGNGSTLWAVLNIINDDKSVAKTFHWGSKI